MQFCIAVASPISVPEVPVAAAVEVKSAAAPEPSPQISEIGMSFNLCLVIFLLVSGTHTKITLNWLLYGGRIA